MELKYFIKETLVQIAEGIEEADKALNAFGTSRAIINPKDVTPTRGNDPTHYGDMNMDSKQHGAVQSIDFDVSVHANEGAEASGKGGISVGSIGFGVKGSTTEYKSSESRIKFKIPMFFPQGGK